MVPPNPFRRLSSSCLVPPTYFDKFTPMPTGFYVGMGWVWGEKFRPHGSLVVPQPGRDVMLLFRRWARRLGSSDRGGYLNPCMFNVRQFTSLSLLSDGCVKFDSLINTLLNTRFAVEVSCYFHYPIVERNTLFVLRTSSRSLV